MKPDEVDVRYYEDEAGQKPFAKFFKRIRGMAAAKITGAIARLKAGNTGDSKSVGKGVSESATTSRAGGMRKAPGRGRHCWWSLIFKKNFGSR